MTVRSPIRHSTIFKLAGVAFVAVLALSACGDDSTDSSSEPSPGTSSEQMGDLTVAAFNFGESKILANMYALVLDDAGYNADVKELTTREVVAPALEEGKVDVVPEYIGTYTEYLNVRENGEGAKTLATTDPQDTLAALQPLANSVGVTVLEPSQAQDQNSFAVTADFAEQNNLETLSDLGALGGEYTLGGPPECPKRPFCQPGLEDTYGINISEFKPLDTGGPLTKEAISDGTVDIGLVFSSDGGIEDLGLKVLADDQNLQTADNVVPVMNTDAYSETAASALNSISDVLTTDDLIALNNMVDIERKQPEEVAQTWLTDQGLIS
ncbi:MAG TPA: ABC transporter substrate-binding protein [Actinomycetes bacterium]|nr:ABC transporter substrate-binding protein [Actinomycetes bacterium]